MPRALKDMAGKRIGILAVIQRAENRGKSVYWLCRCDCGVVKEMAASALRSGITVSCGCHRRKVAAENARKLSLSHGKSRTLLYRVWQSFRDRCNNPGAQAYEHYGARGISVCPEWEDFIAFEAWAFSSGYKAGLTLDRIDNDKGYGPENCRWATMAQQNNNKRTNHFLTHNGKTKTISEWSRETGLKIPTIHSRLRSGLPTSQVLDPALKGNYRHKNFRGFPKTRAKTRNAHHPADGHKKEARA